MEAKIVLIPHPDNKSIFYNANQIVKVEKEAVSIYWFSFANGDRVRFFNPEVINKVRDITDVKF
jgi:hypothetical protein